MRVDLVLRRLHRDEVLHAALVEPVARRDLDARRQRDQQVARDVALGEPDLRRPWCGSTSTRSSGCCGTCARCTSAAPGIVAHPLGDLLRHARRWPARCRPRPPPARRSARRGRSSAPASRCRARGRRRSCSGNCSRERRAQLAHVVGGRRVAFLERDEDLAVGRRDQRALAERQVDAAVRGCRCCRAASRSRSAGSPARIVSSIVGRTAARSPRCGCRARRARAA